MTACWEECRREDGVCEGNTLRTCSDGATEPGGHDHFEDTDCGRMGATCMESADEPSAACVFPDAPCEPGEPNVCSGPKLRWCFEGFAVLDLGDWSVHEQTCEHGCMRSEVLGTSHCVEPDPTCVRAGSVRCVGDPNQVGSSRPDFELCIEPGWSTAVDCGSELCLDPADESDPCVSLGEARARLDAGAD